MKILIIILEAILSPFSLLLRLCGIGKNSFSKLAKPIFILLIAVGITAVLILYFYRESIFK